MSHFLKGLLAVPIAIALSAGTAMAQHGGGHAGGGHAGGGHMGGVHPGGIHTGGIHPGMYSPGIYRGNVAPVGHPSAYFGNVRPIGYGGFYNYGSPFFGSFGYPYGGSGISIGFGGYRYGGYGGYGGYGLGYPLGVGSSYGVRSYGTSMPSYSSVLGTPATLGIYPAPATTSRPVTPVVSGEPAAATVTVLIPDGAELWFNGKEQPSTSVQFISDPIQPGQSVTLDIQAKWDGSTRKMSLPLRAGDKMTVDLRN